MATDKPPSVCNEPSVLEVASVALLTFNIPAADTVAPVVPPKVDIPLTLIAPVISTKVAVISTSPLELIFRSFHVLTKWLVE